MRVRVVMRWLRVRCFVKENIENIISVLFFSTCAIDDFI